MPFIFSNANIQENRIVFIYEECAYSGVRRIAGRVRDDIRKVFGTKPIGVEYANFADTAAFFPYPVFFGTVGKSEILDKLAETNAINLFDIAGESEVYSFRVVEDLEYKGFTFKAAIIIAGSDIRGTIYGLFRLSEMFGVSPLSDWLDIKCPKLEKYTLTPSDSVVSKAPSVKYRGFCLNSDSAAFTRWCRHNFDGSVDKAYARIIELLLRLKGNLLCPLTEGSELSEEYGIVPGPSKDEPRILFDVSYPPKIYEVMSSVYEQGNREMWIANAGDIFTREYPLAFFLDLAYDFNRWKGEAEESAQIYSMEFVRCNFARLPRIEQSEIARLLLGCSKYNDVQRPRDAGLGAGTQFAFGEGERVLNEIDNLMNSAAQMYRKMGDDDSFAFYELVYLPVTARLNALKMLILTDLNHAYASFGSTMANTLAQSIHECIKKDRKLMEKLDSIHKGKWRGMSRSAGIGLDRAREGFRYPVVHTFDPVPDPYLIVSVPATGEHSSPGHDLLMNLALDPLTCGGFIELSTGSESKVYYDITSEDDFIDVMDPGKSVKYGQSRRPFIFVDRLKLNDKEHAEGIVCITSGDQIINIRVPVYNPRISEDE